MDKLLSQRVPGLALIAGVLFLFPALFRIDVRDASVTKAIVEPREPFLIAAAIGVILVSFGLSLYLLERRLPSDAVSAMTGGIVFVLRHMYDTSDYRPADHFAQALYFFNHQTAQDSDLLQIDEGWTKASEYAVKYLVAFRLAEPSHSGGEYVITNKGRRFHDSAVVRGRFGDAFRAALRPAA